MDHGKRNIPRNINWKSTSTDYQSTLEPKTERSFGGVRSADQTEDGQLLITLRSMIQISSLPTKGTGNIMVKQMLEKVSLLNTTYGQRKSNSIKSNLRNNRAKASRGNNANVSHVNDLGKDSTTRPTGFIADNVNSIG